MKKIGFIDYFLDEWHANNYPAWIRERAMLLGLEWEVAYAWAEIDKDDGMTTDEWCDKHGVQRVTTIEELIARSDAMIILSSDHPEHHERLSKLALQSGKPVYMDKTFAPDLAAAKRMFEQAESSHTPLFSSSALRFAVEVQQHKAYALNEQIEFLAVTGPGMYANYAVHQFEMIITLMGLGAQRIKSLSTEHCNHLLIDYDHGRKASFLQTNPAPFQAIVTYEDGEGQFIAQCSDIFIGLIDHILKFFDDKQVPVTPKETLAVIALIEAGEQALASRDTWIEIKR